MRLLSSSRQAQAPGAHAAAGDAKLPPANTLAFTSEAIAEAAHLARTQWPRLPRLDFQRPLLVRALRLLMPVIGRILSPARQLGLRPQRLTVSTGPTEAVKIRLIEPAQKPLGIVVDIHGGAWTSLGAINDDPLTVPIAQDGFVVISVDYRLIPQYRLEDAIQDCSQALQWALSGACARYGVNHVLLHGDSAGAHLALCAALQARHHPRYDRLSGMVLFFGAYDLAGTASVLNAGPETMLLYGPSLRSLFHRVARSSDPAALRNPLVSPLFADLAGAPPSLLIVGTNDPLLDDSLQLHQALQAAGAVTELQVAPHAPHAFNRMPIKMADEANALTRRWMAERSGG